MRKMKYYNNRHVPKIICGGLIRNRIKLSNIDTKYDEQNTEHY